MIEPQTFLPCLGCAKGSKHGGESLAGEVRGGAPLKTAARDLKPNTDDDIGRQLHVLYGQSSLGNRLGKVRLEMFANAWPSAAGTWALRTTSRPQRGSLMAFSRNFVKAKDMRTIGSGSPSRDGAKSSSKLSARLRTYRGDQLLDALEMIVERPLGDACRLDDGVHRESLRRPIREKN